MEGNTEGLPSPGTAKLGDSQPPLLTNAGVLGYRTTTALLFARSSAPRLSAHDDVGIVAAVEGFADPHDWDFFIQPDAGNRTIRLIRSRDRNDDTGRRWIVIPAETGSRPCSIVCLVVVKLHRHAATTQEKRTMARARILRLHRQQQLITRSLLNSCPMSPDIEVVPVDLE